MGADRDLVGGGIVQYDLSQREILLFVADERFGIHEKSFRVFTGR